MSLKQKIKFLPRISKKDSLDLLASEYVAINGEHCVRFTNKIDLVQFVVSHPDYVSYVIKTYKLLK